MVFLGFKGMLADRQLHRKTTEEEVVNGGGVFAVLQPLNNDMEEENGFEIMATEEREEEELRPYLDEGIITKILVKVHSTESLHNSLRYVCKLWSDIISYNPDIHLNLLIPSKATCAIIQRRENKCNPSYTTCLLKMGIREGHVELEQQVDVTPIFKRLFIWDCCNGLVLATDPNRESLCIVNPRTNHSVVLPPRSINADFLLAAAHLTFIPSTGKYKIVTMERHGAGGVPGPYFIQILTMSSSSPSAAAGGHCSPGGGGHADPSPRWRRIEAPSELSCRPITINNVYYWHKNPPGGADYIISFDVASEKFYRTPHKLYSSEACYHYMDNGFMDFEGYLAFWSFRPAYGAGTEAHRRTFNVDVIENLHEKGGEWKELYSGVRIDLDFIQASYVLPCMSFGNGEVMIFRNPQAGTAWAYHFKSQRWLKVGNDLKELHFLNFWGYIVRSSSTLVPFDSLFSLKKTTTTTTTTKTWL